MRISVFLCFYFFISSFLSAQTASNELVDLREISNDFAFEMRYATTHNFLGEMLYDCDTCLLRPEVAKALSEANEYFISKGYRLRIYDCYRPLDVQKKMWEKMPRANYVGNPYKNGSIHNRGAAIDLTLETLEACHVDMGTDHDHLGPAAHIDNLNFSKEILQNRKILTEGMKKFGFSPIRTEWWHFHYKKSYSYPILNDPIPCD